MGPSQPLDTVDPIAKPVPPGEKTGLGAVQVPLDITTAYFSVDSSWHTDPSSIAVWGFEFSFDGGQTWEHRGTATRNGGPATGDGGAPVTVFDMTTDLFGVDAKGKAWDVRGGWIRPFIGVLKGSDPAVSRNVSGEIRFK